MFEHHSLCNGYIREGSLVIEASAGSTAVSKNFIGMLKMVGEMRAHGEQGSVLSLLCDAGERDLPTYHYADWVLQQFEDCSAADESIKVQMN